MEIDISIGENESVNNYIQRMCSSKDALCVSWAGLADIINNEVNLNYSESYYRKNFNNGAFVSTDNELESTSYEETSELDAKLHDIAMKKVELTDLVIQNNAYIRRLSREQTIKDIAHDYAEVMNKSKILYHAGYDPYVTSCEGILLLSDWHYGMVCDNPWNKFDPDICVTRVNKLLDKVISIVQKNNIGHVNVLDLADLIAGRIHTQIRIESRFDVITQTMQVSEILAEFLNTLSKYCTVSFYSCLDNHSRLEPNKKESMDLESLARLIPWYLKERLENNTNIKICENVFGPDIITCKVKGHNVIGVHGDNDKPTFALERLSLMTHQHYDMLCTAHFHHFECNEQHQSVVVSNSSLMGVDHYAEKLRLTSDPSQTFIIATEENVCDCIYRIVL